MKKKIMLVAIIIVALIIAWFSTGRLRYRLSEQHSISKQLENYSGELYIIIYEDEFKDDKQFEKFISKQVEKLISDGKYTLLAEFLDEIDNYRSESVKSDFYNILNDIEIEKKVEICSLIQDVDFYGGDTILTIEDVKKYAEKYGTEPVYFENGQGGYYDAKHKEGGRYYKNDYGYRDYSHTYYGDFDYYFANGVEIVGFTGYETSERSIWFRGNELTGVYSISNPDDVVYSNSYLFVKNNSNIKVFMIKQ